MTTTVEIRPDTLLYSRESTGSSRLDLPPFAIRIVGSVPPGPTNYKVAIVNCSAEAAEYGPIRVTVQDTKEDGRFVRTLRCDRSYVRLADANQTKTKDKTITVAVAGSGLPCDYRRSIGISSAMTSSRRTKRSLEEEQEQEEEEAAEAEEGEEEEEEAAKQPPKKVARSTTVYVEPSSTDEAEQAETEPETKKVVEAKKEQPRPRFLAQTKPAPGVAPPTPAPSRPVAAPIAPVAAPPRPVVAPPPPTHAPPVVAPPPPVATLATITGVDLFPSKRCRSCERVIYGGDSCVLCKAGFAGRMKKAQAEAERAREVIENDALAQIELFKQEKAAYEVYVAQLAANNARFKANIQAQIKELLEEVGIEGELE
jgi:hypothetical protein